MSAVPPSARRQAQEVVATGSGGRGNRSRVRVSAEAAKVAALNQNAGATPQAATRTPASGASAIWETTAVDHDPGDRGEQQHRQDLGDHRAADPKSGAGELEDQHDQRDGVEGVTPPGDGLRGEQPPVARLGEHGD
jgi:hypothetical protein